MKERRRSKKIVALIRDGNLDRETRVTKISKSLIDNGFSIILIYWNKNKLIERSDIPEFDAVDRIICLNMITSPGKMVIISLPLWWLFIFIKLMMTRWDLVHAVQITTILPAILAAKLKRKPVVYDLLDIYEDSIHIPITLRNFIIFIDKIFMRHSTAVILADPEEINELSGIPNPNVISIYDSPSTIEDICLEHNRNEIFTLFFAGNISMKKKLNLDKIFKAIESIENAKVVIAGFGDLVDEVESISQKMPDRVEFIGEISHAEVIKRSSVADALFVLRDSSLLVNKYICGSKILESMMCGRPIIVNKGTSTAKIVGEANCGLIIDANNVKEIKDAIICLMDNKKLANELGRNGKIAFEKHYSWKIMEKNLLDLYRKIID